MRGEHTSPTALQSFAMDEELRTAFGLLKHGLASLQALSGANDFYHLPFLLLASGLERICKCVLAFKHLKDRGCFPKKSEFKRYAHDVVELVERIANDCFDDDYLHRAAAAADRHFLRSDATLKEILICLRDFGGQGRYEYLDIIAGEPAPSPSPQQRWDKLEIAIAKGCPGVWKRSVENHEDISSEINQPIVAVVERLARALSRLFTLGPLAEEAKRHLCSLDHFLYLTDRDLGQTDYWALLSPKP